MQKQLFQGTAKNAPMTPKEASVYTGFSVATLRKWRAERKGPQYFKYNKRIYYNKDDIDTFLNSVFCPNLKSD